MVLASRSPRRASLLRDAGFTFDVEPADVNEKEYSPGTLPSEVAQQLARAKAKKLAADERFRDAIILAADTIVALGDSIIGKPRDVTEARFILRQLSGATHIVITGVAIVMGSSTDEIRSRRVMSAVRMEPLTERRLERYLASGLWRDKAGAYGIQDPDPIVQLITGCRTNVIGLPMTTTSQLLAEFGVEPKNEQ